MWLHRHRFLMSYSANLSFEIWIKWMLVEMLLGQRIVKTLFQCRCTFSHECKLLNKSLLRLCKRDRQQVERRHVPPLFLYLFTSAGYCWLICIFPHTLDPRVHNVEEIPGNRPVHQEEWRALEEGHSPAVWLLSSPLFQKTEGLLPESHKRTFR